MTESKPRFTAVTALYDVGRAAIDGRTAQDYVGWLNKTLQTPLPFIVFLDPSFDASALELKTDDMIVRVPRDALRMFGHKAEIERICATSDHVNRRDIAFKLPAYGMMVMSKIELLERASTKTKADFLVWIDAGHSRFAPDLSGLDPVIGASDLDGVTIALNATEFFAQFKRMGRLPKDIVGSCLALMSAMDFIVAREFARELADRFHGMVENEWLPAGRWDNEQVALGTLLFRGGIPGAKIVSTTANGQADVVRWLYGVPRNDLRVPFDVRWRLLRRWARTLRTPKKDCYLPGDFQRLPG